LPANEKNSFLKHIYETLEMRVGIRLADQMSNEQLDEFERYFEAKDDAGAFKWLEANFPNYKEIVQQEFDKLKAEVGQAAPQILAASQQAQAAGSPPPAAAMAQPPTPVADQAAFNQPVQGPNSQQPQQPTELGTPPQAAPAPAQPYAAPPVSPTSADQPAPQPFVPPNQQPEPNSPFPNQQPPAGPGFGQQQPPQFPPNQ